MHVRAGDVELCFELLGPDDGIPIVLIGGVYQQLSSWPDPFIEGLIGAGLQVLVFDNRDVGYSSRETRPAPDLSAVFGGDVSGVNYTLSDMAADTAELIRAVGWESAHVFGHSLGGGIAQRVATEHPEVIRTLILMGTGPGDGVTGMINPKFAPFRMPPADRSPEALTGWLTGFHRFCIDPDPVDESSLTSFVRRQVERAPNADMQCVPAGVASNQLGLASTPSHPDLLSELQIATLVIGGTADRVVAFDGSERLGELIPGSTLLRIEGMGHLPLDPSRWSPIADAIGKHARQG